MKFLSVSQPGQLLLLSAFCFYCLLSPGNLSGDTEVRWSVSRQFVRMQGFDIERHISTRYYAAGVDGKRYSFWGPGQQVVLLPFAYLGLFLERGLGISEDQSDLCAQFLAALFLFPGLGAITVWLLFKFLLLLGYSTKNALVSAAIFGFATMHVHYTVFAHEQGQVALMVLVQFWCMVKVFQTNRFSYIWLFCVAMGGALFFRLSSFIETFIVFAVAFFFSVTAQQQNFRYGCIRKWSGALALGTGPFIALLAGYNYTRFGSFFETGYGLASATMFGGNGAFQTNPFESIPAILLSPGKSIFLYNPVLILSIVCFYRFYQRHKPVAIAAAAVVAGNIIFNSFYTTWAGDYAWSCRYQASVLPLLALPIVCFFGAPRNTLVQYVCRLLIIVSLLIQVASTVYSFNLEFVQNPNHGLIPDGYVWKWKESHMMKRFENITRHVLDTREFTTAFVADEDPALLRTNMSEKQVKQAYIVNFFPFKAAVRGVSAGIVRILICVWVLFFVLLFLSVIKLRGLMSGTQPEPATSPAS